MACTSGLYKASVLLLGDHVCEKSDAVPAHHQLWSQQGMERGMRQKSSRRNSGEDVKIMREREIELETSPEIELEIELENELEIELEQGQEFGDHERRSPMTMPNMLKHSMEQAVLDFAEGNVLSVPDRQLPPYR